MANCAVGYDNVVRRRVRAARGVVVADTLGVLDESTADVACRLILDHLQAAGRVLRPGSCAPAPTPGLRPAVFVGLRPQRRATLGIVGQEIQADPGR